MIYSLRRKKPFITWGLGRTEITITAGENVYLWVQTLYDGLYTSQAVFPTGVSSAKVSNQQFRITSSTVGTYEIRIDYPKQNLKSNTIILNVV